MKTIAASCVFIGLSCGAALGWGQEGHSIVADVAQHRLTPAAAADVARLLGANHDATTQCVSESAA